MTTVVGLDVGHRVVRACVVQRRRGKLEVKGCAEVPRKDDAGEDKPLATAVAELDAILGFGDRVVVAVNSLPVLVRFVSTMALPPDRLARLMRLEMGQHADGHGDLAADCQVVPVDGDELVHCCVIAQPVQTYDILDELRKARIGTPHLHFAPAALYNATLPLPPVTDSALALLVDIGAATTGVTLFGDQRLLAVRQVPVGGDTFGVAATAAAERAALTGATATGIGTAGTASAADDEFSTMLEAAAATPEPEPSSAKIPAQTSSDDVADVLAESSPPDMPVANWSQDASPPEMPVATMSTDTDSGIDPGLELDLDGIDPGPIAATPAKPAESAEPKKTALDFDDDSVVISFTDPFGENQDRKAEGNQPESKQRPADLQSAAAQPAASKPVPAIPTPPPNAHAPMTSAPSGTSPQSAAPPVRPGPAFKAPPPPTRALVGGDPELTRAAESLFNQLTSSLSWFRVQLKQPKLTISGVFLVGGGADVPGLEGYLARRFGLPVAHFDPFGGLTGKLPAQPHAYATALGLALAHPDLAMAHASRLDLRPESLIRRQKWWSHLIWPYVAAAAIIIAGILYCLTCYNDHEQLRENVAAYDAYQKQYTTDKLQLDALIAEKGALSDDLRAIASRIYAGRDLLYTIRALKEQTKESPELWVTELKTLSVGTAADTTKDEMAHGFVANAIHNTAIDRGAVDITGHIRFDSDRSEVKRGLFFQDWWTAILTWSPDKGRTRIFRNAKPVFYSDNPLKTDKPTDHQGDITWTERFFFQATDLDAPPPPDAIPEDATAAEADVETPSATLSAIFSATPAVPAPAPDAPAPAAQPGDR